MNFLANPVYEKHKCRCVDQIPEEPNEECLLMKTAEDK